MKRVIAFAVLLVVLAAPAWAGFDEGVAAHKRGDYATAMVRIVMKRVISTAVVLPEGPARPRT